MTWYDSRQNFTAFGTRQSREQPASLFIYRVTIIFDIQNIATRCGKEEQQSCGNKGDLT
jgi:hypothetical protein